MRIHFAVVKQWLHYFLTPNSNHQLLTLHHTFSRMFEEFDNEKASFRDERALAELIMSISNYIEWNGLIICKFEDFYRWKTLIFQIEETKTIFNSYQWSLSFSIQFEKSTKKTDFEHKIFAIRQRFKWVDNFVYRAYICLKIRFRQKAKGYLPLIYNNNNEC